MKLDQKTPPLGMNTARVLAPAADRATEPAIMFFGTKDNFRISADAARAQLKRLGNATCEMWTAVGQNHGCFNAPPWMNLTLAATDRFLGEHGFLKGSDTLVPPASGEKLVKAT